MPYHITRKGEPGVCRAKAGQCPLGDTNEHFATKDDARVFYENKNGANVTTMTKTFDPSKIVATKLSRDVLEDPSTAKIPAGRYFIGDPCYGVSDKTSGAWDKWCDAAEQTNPAFKNIISGATLDGHLIIGVSTSYGDGEYVDSRGRHYPVDSGQIGIVDANFIKKQGLSESDIDDLGHFVTFDEPVRLTRTEDGDILIGNISIPTGDIEEEDYEDEYEDEDFDEYEDEGPIYR